MKVVGRVVFVETGLKTLLLLLLLVVLAEVLFNGSNPFIRAVTEGADDTRVEDDGAARGTLLGAYDPSAQKAATWGLPFLHAYTSADAHVGPWPSPQPPRVDLPADQYWLGDSQISGRAAGLTRSNETAFHALWSSFYAEPWNTAIEPMAKGGRGLQGHLQALQALWAQDATPRGGPEWVHLAESGDQNEPGQRTPKQYGDTFVRYMRWLHQASPHAIVSIETPFSFGREKNLLDEGRDWTQYRLELMARVHQLREEGITVHLVDTDHRIRALSHMLSPEEVWFQPGTPAQYHFTEVGNLMTALTLYWHLGYDVNAIDFQPILNEGLVTRAQIDACLAVLNAPYP